MRKHLMHMYIPAFFPDTRKLCDVDSSATSSLFGGSCLHFLHESPILPKSSILFPPFLCIVLSQSPPLFPLPFSSNRLIQFSDIYLPELLRRNQNCNGTVQLRRVASDDLTVQLAQLIEFNGRLTAMRGAFSCS